jgi:hypothetical protein
MKIKGFLKNYLNNPSFANKNLNVWTVRAIMLIIEDKLTDYVIFENAGGVDFQIWYPSPIYKINAKGIAEMVKDRKFRPYIFAYCLNGKETILQEGLKYSSPIFHDPVKSLETLIWHNKNITEMCFVDKDQQKKELKKLETELELTKKCYNYETIS